MQLQQSIIINTQKSYQTKHIKQAELVEGESSRNWRVRLSMAQQVFLEVSSTHARNDISSHDNQGFKQTKGMSDCFVLPTSTQVIDFHLGLRLPSQNYTCPEGNGVEEYFRSRRSRGAFQKRCRQKVLSIEGSAVVFIGIGSHILSLR